MTANGSNVHYPARLGMCAKAEHLACVKHAESMRADAAKLRGGAFGHINVNTTADALSK
jgi:hypothetical protein